MCRLLLVEDHVLVRQSIRAFLESAGFESVAEAGTGEEAVTLIQTLQPQIVILDIHLPGISGIDVARYIDREFPSIRMIALTAYNEKAYQTALEAIGVGAFVLKTAELSELLTVVRQVVSTLPPSPVRQPESPRLLPVLTEREIEVLTSAAHGWTNKQIAAHLCISDRTVQVHLQSIYHKLDVSNRTEAVLRALAFRLVPTHHGEVE